MITFACQAQTGIFSTFLYSANNQWMDPGSTGRAWLRLFAKLPTTACVDTTFHVRPHLSMYERSATNQWWHTAHIIPGNTGHTLWRLFAKLKRGFLVPLLCYANNQRILGANYIHGYVCLPSSRLLVVSMQRPTCAHDLPSGDPTNTYLRYFMPCTYVCSLRLVLKSG